MTSADRPLRLVHDRGEVENYTLELRRFLGMPAQEHTELTFCARERSISGHDTEAMEEHYSTVCPEEQRDSNRQRSSSCSALADRAMQQVVPRPLQVVPQMQKRARETSLTRWFR